MTSVTGRIKQVKQPRGGYINPRSLIVVALEGEPLHDVKETVSAGIVGMVVDYMTRFMTGTPVEKAFHISIFGAKLIGRDAEALEFAHGIKDLDDESIVRACRLANFDAVFRAGCGLPGCPYPLPEPETITPDADTCDNIRIMVGRSLAFFEKYGPVVADGITFQGGYTDAVTAGDGDFLTRDTVWDFKTNKTKPSKDHTLQICMYWLMGLHSIHAGLYKDVDHLGFFNPRRGEVSAIATAELDRPMLHEIETQVIGYAPTEAVF